MRSSFFVAAPFLAIASAATTRYGTTLVPEISGSVTVTSTFTYNNPATSLLTQTNSNGVITGQPAGNGPTGLVTSQPAVATIPAGLPTGETTFFYSASSTLESFAVSIGAKTTVVLSGNQVGPSASVIAGSSAGVNPAGKGSGSNGGGSGGGKGGSGSGSSSSGNAAPTQMRAAAGMLALGAVAAVFL